MLVAAKVAGKKVEVQNKAAPENSFPLGVTPALEDGSVHLFGADAIAKYLVGYNTAYVPQVFFIKHKLFNYLFS